MFKSAPNHTRGFTLLELLIVLFIIGILSTIVIVVIQPQEIMRRGRDDVRLHDLNNLKQAITIALAEGTGSNLVCQGVDLSCNGQSYPASVAKKASDGTGWVRINVKDQKSISLPTLPLDPINNATYHFTYCGVVNSGVETWEIDTVLESNQEKDKMLNISDGGNEDDRYEVGSTLTAIAPEGAGSCTY